MLTLNAEPIIINCLSYLTSNINDANEMIENEGFLKVIEVFEQFVKDFANNTPLTLFYKNNLDVLGNKDKLKTFLVLLEGFIRDIVEYQNSNEVLVFNSFVEEIKVLAQRIDQNDILRYLFVILELIKKIGYNVNMSLLINQFLIDLNGGI